MKYLSIFLALIVLASCSTTRNVTKVPQEVTEKVQMDTVFVTAPKGDVKEEQKPPYRASFQRDIDITHTKLDLKFDWANELVIGKAWVDLQPQFMPVNEIVLDAVNFEINKIELINYTGNYESDYSDDKITIQLEQPLLRGNQVKVFVDYIAKPRAEGGSSAITSDKGLFFINPLGDEDKPQQIWTQGETEHNSKWFPTVDKPNERTTQEISVTVPSKFTSLSNGLMTNSKNNSDGTRTDTWVMDMPHAPYLFMLAIGEFAVVKEDWRDIELLYLVEKEYEEDAKLIFNHTPEMLDYFSDLFGLEYPWQKYAQVVVRDYVSGAMENTTAVIFGEFVQKHADELLDANNDGIVAHELAHHWFGDYVTCESWSNLTMNEGFANYSEYLWQEYKYGKDAADNHLMNELYGYLGQANSGGAHPLIHFHYEDKEDMFDAHSYNKGGMVLHMLRNYLGDEAFFASLKTFLENNAFQAVEVHDLRLAFEKVTGMDLNWFFNQWYLSAGHPQIQVSHTFNPAENRLMTVVEQTQEGFEIPEVFYLPAEIAFVNEQGQSTIEKIWVDARVDTFYFQMNEQPVLVNFDPNNILLIEEEEEKSIAELKNQLKYSPNVIERFDAAQSLANSEAGNPEFVEALISDNDANLNIMGLNMLSPDMLSEKTSLLMRRLKNESTKPELRAVIVQKLAQVAGTQLLEVLPEIIESKNSSATLTASAMNALINLDLDKSEAYIPSFRSKTSGAAAIAVGNYLVKKNETDDDFFLSKFDSNMGFGEKLAFVSLITEYIKGKEVDEQINFANALKGGVLGTKDVVSKVVGVKLLAELSNQLIGNEKSLSTGKEIMAAAKDLVDKETNSQIKSYMMNFLGM